MNVTPVVRQGLQAGCHGIAPGAVGIAEIVVEGFIMSHQYRQNKPRNGVVAKISGNIPYADFSLWITII